jgi:hypothetical protein
METVPVVDSHYVSRCRYKQFIIATIAAVALWVQRGLANAGAFDFPPSDFKILNAADTRVTGNGHYEVKSDNKGYAIALGEDHFNDGEYDIERDDLELRGDNQIPRMLMFEHTFFNANGTLQRVNKANFQTGLASCTVYENGRPKARSAELQFPPDTFAGAAIVIPLQDELRQGASTKIVLHDFSCVPEPRILKVDAYPQPPSKWVHFPGEVIRVDVKPDFGWLNLILSIFVPEIRAWFSPSMDWRFVGGRFTRYYGGPEIILVLIPKAEQKNGDPHR